MRLLSARRGISSIVAFTTLVVVSALAASMLLMIVRATATIPSNRNVQQTLWLAESGIERATAAILNNADYDGEELTIQAGDLDESLSASEAEKTAGQITIRVRMEEDGSRLISSTAVFPLHPINRIRKTREVRLPPIQ